MKKIQFFVIFCLIFSAKTIQSQMVTSINSDTVEVDHFATGLGLSYLYTNFTYIDGLKEGESFQKWVEYPHANSKSKILSLIDFKKIASTHDLLSSTSNLDKTVGLTSSENVNRDTLFIEKSNFCYHDFIYDNGTLHVFLLKKTMKYFSIKHDITLREVKKVLSYDTSLRYDISAKRYVSTEKIYGQFWSIPSRKIKIITYAEKEQLHGISELSGIKFRG